ncbi:MAG: tyrosine-type recombinase/integrase [Xanthobacteraceae bacterium]
MPKLTKRFVESLKPAAKDQVIFDAEIAGFGVRVVPSGMRSYLVQYRNASGRSRRLTIGKHGKVTADGARKDALRIFDAVRSGKDPVAERRAYIDAPIVNDLLDRYVAEHVEKRNRPRTREEVKRLVERHIRPQLGRHKVAAVTRQDVAKMHRMLEATPRQANFVLAVCSKAFSLAELWAMRPEGSNPCTRIERNREHARERFLSAEELERLGDALRRAETEGLPWKVNERKPKAKHLPKPENRRTLYPRVNTAAVELLLYTGCRLSEVLNLRWDQVTFADCKITLDETKAGRRQVVAMNAPAQRVLTALFKAKRSSWVLPSTSDAQRPLSKAAIEAAWQKIRTAAGIEDVRLHDLRHTVGTYAGQSGANAFLVRDLLRHKSIAMTGRYVNQADDPVRTLSDQVGERIAAGLAGRKEGEVVPLNPGAQLRVRRPGAGRARD